MMAQQHVNVGFDPANVFSLQFRLPPAKYPKPEDIARFFKQTIERMQAVPGVQSAALVRRVPFSGNWGDTPFVVEGRTPEQKRKIAERITSVLIEDGRAKRENIHVAFHDVAATNYAEAGVLVADQKRAP